MRPLSVATGLVGIRHGLGSAIQHGLLPYGLWTRLPVAREFRVPIGGGRSFWYSSTPTDHVGRRLFWKGLGGWEPETTMLFAHLAQRSRVVLDIGANTGLYSLLACASTSRSSVIAFEPVTHIRDRLIFQVHLNGWEDRCQAVGAAVSDRDEMLHLHVPLGELPQSASLDPDGFRHAAGTLVETPAVSIDSFCASADHIDLVKIDVEGFEDRVIAGMADVLATHKPTIFFEVLVDAPARRIKEILTPFGYKIFKLTATGPDRVATIVPDATQRCRNFAAAVRNDDIHELDTWRTSRQVERT